MTESSTSTTGRCQPAWPKDALRVAFGVILAIDAALEWLPGFRAGHLDAITGAGDGQPGWLRPWFRSWTDLQQPHPYFWAYLVAGLETLIAAALIAGFARKLTYLAATGFAVLIWATAESFGGPYTAGASDIRTGIIYAVVFLGLLALSYNAGPARYSADYYLEQRISWWWHLAETRSPAPAQPAVPAQPEPGRMAALATQRRSA